MARDWNLISPSTPGRTLPSGDREVVRRWRRIAARCYYVGLPLYLVLEIPLLLLLFPADSKRPVSLFLLLLIGPACILLFLALWCQSTYARHWAAVYLAVGQSAQISTAEALGQRAAAQVEDAPETSWPKAVFSATGIKEKVDVGLFEWGIQLTSRMRLGRVWRLRWSEIAGAELIGRLIAPQLGDSVFLRLVLRDPSAALLVNWSLLRWPRNLREQFEVHGLKLEDNTSSG